LAREATSSHSVGTGVRTSEQPGSASHINGNVRRRLAPYIRYAQRPPGPARQCCGAGGGLTKTGGAGAHVRYAQQPRAAMLPSSPLDPGEFSPRLACEAHMSDMRSSPARQCCRVHPHSRGSPRQDSPDAGRRTPDAGRRTPDAGRRAPGAGSGERGAGERGSGERRRVGGAPCGHLCRVSGGRRGRKPGVVAGIKRSNQCFSGLPESP
jgi:hypothetical protein